MNAAFLANDTPVVSMPPELRAVMAAAISAAESANDGPPLVEDEYGWSTNVLQSEIKSEPPVEIDDTQGSGGGGDLSGPKIRLTPTNKLLADAAPNATTAMAMSMSATIKTETPEKPDPRRKFVCPYENCTKSYGKSSHLRSHLTWHTGIKPFVCLEPFCGKGFTRSDELNRHVRTHTGEKPFECVQCTKKFSRSDHLTKHLATHAKQMLSGVATSTTTTTPRRSRSDTIAMEESVASATNSSNRTYAEMKRPAKHLHYADGLHFMAALIESSNAAAHGHDATKDNNGSAGAGAGHGRGDENEEMENLTNEAPTLFGHKPISIKVEQPESGSDSGKAEYRATPPQQQLKRKKPFSQPTQLTPRRHITASESEDELLPPEMIVPVSALICPPSPQPASYRSNSSFSCSPNEIKAEPNDFDEDANADTDDAIMPEANGPPLKKTTKTTTTTTTTSTTTTSTTTTPITQTHKESVEALPDRKPTATTMTAMTDGFAYNGPKITAEVAYDPERPFKCAQCPKCFKRQDDLNRHMRTHTGEKPFACGECERRFMRSDHLKKHVKTHTKVQKLKTTPKIMSMPMPEGLLVSAGADFPGGFEGVPSMTHSIFE